MIDALLESLPTYPSLLRRFRNSTLKGKLRAKTGSIKGVTALSGVLETDAGMATFSLLFHGNQAQIGAVKNWQQAFLEEVARSYPKIDRSGLGG